MNDRAQDFDQLLGTIKVREQRSRRNALLWTIVPIVAAAALLGYSSWRLQTASQEVDALEQKARAYEAQAETARLEVDELTGQVETLRDETTSLRQHLEETQKLLRESLELSQYRYVVDPVDVKAIASRTPIEARILDYIIELGERGVDWQLGGRTPLEGFDSPGFAEHVLRHFDLGGGVRPGRRLPLIAASRALYETLPAVDTPEPGDLAFYPAGYVMFYFRSARGEPFVMGMTPFGIAAFKDDFAKVVGYRRPGRP